MEEQWKVIISNPNYEISSLGNIRNKNNKRILHPTIHGDKRGLACSYLRVELKQPKKKYLVHRLVAEAFIENPLTLPEINHKDENGLNNYIMNLEWCTNPYNIRYSHFKIVLQKTKLGIVLKEFPSVTDAANITGSDVRLISAVCLGKRQSHNGFKWEYKNKEDLLTKRRGNGRLIA